MRLSVNDGPSIILFVLPLVISYYRFNVYVTIFILILLCLFKLFTCLPKGANKKLKLNSILISHYSEKVRWCLEFCKIEFIEEFDSAIFGILFFGRSIPTLYNPSVRTTIGNSSDILRYIYGKYYSQNQKVAKLLNPTKESLEMEALFDEKLGRAIQRIFYFELWRNRKLNRLFGVAWGSTSNKIPFYQRWLLFVLVPIYKLALKHFLNLNEQTFKKSMDDIQEIFELVEKRLSDNKFIMGDEISFVDITFCSLGAHLIVNGDTFANGLVKEAWLDLDKNQILKTLETYKYIKKFRKMKAAQFIRDIYKTYRNV